MRYVYNRPFEEKKIKAFISTYNHVKLKAKVINQKLVLNVRCIESGLFVK